ncbi:MAG: hypothetical protein PHW82_17535 [Bacteroidales bacterium]|nr:hypothetical protein [Bacteroidales bacterium]
MEDDVLGDFTINGGKISLFIEDKDVQIFKLSVPIEVLAYHIQEKKDLDFSIESWDEKIKITFLDIQNYFNFFSPDILKVKKEITFYFDIETFLLLDPSIHNMVLIFESTFFTKFLVNGELKTISIVPLSVNLVKNLLKNKDSFSSQNIQFFDHEKLERIYLDFKEKSKEENFINLAYDDSEMIGYIIGASLENDVSKPVLYLVE